ncbi:hypothetical protein BJ742DRAFT_805605 [Cladochytrium replicatum]|nr:hypothetical protein BJ742DRAFT_805605 [Cladochytrium replicatum]
MASSNDILVGKVLNSVVDHVNIQVTSILNSTAGLVLSSLQSPSVFDTVTKSTNFTTDTRLNLWMNSLLNQSTIPQPSLIFCQRKNLNNDAPVDASSDTRVNVWWSPNNMYWCNYQNYTHCSMAPFNSSTGVVVTTVTHPYIKPFMVNNAFTCAVQASCPKSGGIWKAELVSSSLFLTYAACAPPVTQYGSTPPYSTSFPIIAGDLITGIFFKLAPSQNSRLFLINSVGELLAANAVSSVANAAKNFVMATDANDTSTAQLAQDINQRTANFSSINTITGSLIQTTITGEDWTYSVRMLQVQSSVSMYLVAAIPRQDFFSAIDSAQRTSITVTIVFAAVSMIVVIIVIIGITLPVRTLTAEMSKVATFDFSMLERGFFVENSVFTEIRNMQRTFNTLVKAFAGAISRNKGLTNNTSSMALSSSQHGRGTR